MLLLTTIQQTGEAWLPDAPHRLLCKHAPIGSLNRYSQSEQLSKAHLCVWVVKVHLCIWVVKTHLCVWVGIPGWHADERQPQQWQRLTWLKVLVKVAERAATGLLTSTKRCRLGRPITGSSSFTVATLLSVRSRICVYTHQICRSQFCSAYLPIPDLLVKSLGFRVLHRYKCVNGWMMDGPMEVCSRSVQTASRETTDSSLAMRTAL